MRLSNLMLIFLIFGAICMASTAQLPDNMKMNSNCSVIKSGEIASIGSNIDTGNSQATFILSWLNATSNLDMVLSAPDGKRIDSTAMTSDTYRKNDTMVQYIISDPMPGNWTANITASKTSELGEGYCVLTLLTLAETETNASINESDNITGKDITQECPTCGQAG
jgi:hypothetical protein